MPSEDGPLGSRTGCNDRFVSRSVARPRLNCRRGALRKSVGKLSCFGFGLVAAMAGLAAPSVPAQAQVRDWVPPVLGDWADNSNWNPGFKPTAADDAVIDNGGTALVSTSGDLARNLTLGGSAGSGTVTIFDPGLLTVNSLANSSIVLGPSTGSLGTLNIGSINPPGRGGAQQPKISSSVKAGLERSQSKTVGR
jgi:hypothetical protein